METVTQKDERYLVQLFSLLKKRDGVVVTNKKSNFNDTELRLLGEILAATQRGERLISTQLAKRLGITRSAISQIVQRLEREGVVRRVPDAVDRKIAYVEIEEKALEAYAEDFKASVGFVGDLVRKYGEEKFEKMCTLVEEFVDLLEEKKQGYEVKHRR